MRLRTRAYDAWWWLRGKAARLLVRVAFALDNDVGEDIYRGNACADICMDIYHRKLTLDEAREAIYYAMH